MPRPSGRPAGLLSVGSGVGPGKANGPAQARQEQELQPRRDQTNLLNASRSLALLHLDFLFFFFLHCCFKTKENIQVRELVPRANEASVPGLSGHCHAPELPLTLPTTSDLSFLFHLLEA